MTKARTSSFRTRRNSSGFTLIELMLVVALMAILFTVAVPNFTSFIRNQQVKAASFELYSVLTYARSEALKLNQNVIVNAKEGIWNNGWDLKAANAPSGSEPILTSGTKTGITIVADVNSVTYRPDGRTNTIDRVEFIVCDSKGSASVLRRLVRVDTSGRPNLSYPGFCDE